MYGYVKCDYFYKFLLLIGIFRLVLLRMRHSSGGLRMLENESKY